MTISTVLFRSNIANYSHYSQFINFIGPGGVVVYVISDMILYNILL